MLKSEILEIPKMTLFYRLIQFILGIIVKENKKLCLKVKPETVEIV